MGTLRNLKTTAALLLVASLWLAPGAANAQQVAEFSSVLYVPNFYEGTVSVLDLDTNTVIDTISLGSPSGPIAVVAANDGTRIYVVESFLDTVAIVDAADGMVVDRVSTGSLPLRATLNEDDSRLYVTNFFSESVTVIDTETASVVDTIALDNGIAFPSYPVGITFSPDFSELWVASQFPGRVDLIDPASNAVVDTIPINVTAPVDIKFSDDGSLIYVVGHATDGLGIPDATCMIDSSTRAVLGEVLSTNDEDLGPGLAAVAIAGNGAAYASNSGPVDGSFNPVAPFTDSVTKIELNGTTTRIPSGGLTPAGISTSPDGRYLYVSHVSSANIGIIDTDTDTLVGTVDVGARPGFADSAERASAPPASGPTVPAASVNTRKLLIDKNKNKATFDFQFALGNGAGTPDPLTEDVFVQFDGFWVSIPAGSFEQTKRRQWKYRGRVDGVRINVTINLKRNGQWQLKGNFNRAPAVDTITNDVSVTFRIGDDGHSADMTASITGG